jgi:two-component system, cell cycle sensor histidine kinase and response regulator CckA
MLLFTQPYTLLLVTSVVIPALLAIAVLIQRPSLGNRSFAVLMAGVSLWSFAALFEVCAQDPQTKIFSYGIKFIFIVSVPLSWLTFSLYYANRIRVLRISMLMLLALPQIITLILVATNPMHQLMFTAFEIVTVGRYHLLYPHFGPWFWVHAGYSYLLLFAGFVLLAKHLLDSPAHYRRPVIALMIGGSAPWISNIFFVFNIGTLSKFDLTPIAFIISGLAFMWGILRYRILDIVPIARDIVIQNMGDGVVVVDLHQHILDINPAAARLMEVEPRKLIGSKASQVIAWWPKLITEGEVSNGAVLPIIELTVDHQSRLLRPLQSPLYGKEKTMGYLVTLRDVTATLMAERALRYSEERFKSFSENAPVIIFALDDNGIISYVNRAWQNTLGHPLREVGGKKFADFVAPEDRDTCAETFAHLINGQRSTAEVNVRLPQQDGSMRLFSISVTTNSDAEGRMIGILGLAKDVTTERRLQKQLAQSQKMKAVGTLAGGVAHDFNNLLMGIQANISLMRLETAPNSPQAEKLNRIEDQIHSGATLTRQLLGYARKGKYRVADLDMTPLIKDALHVVQRANKDITVHCRTSTNPAHIKADKCQIELVLLNLFLNAADAMPEGGELSVETRVLSTAELPHNWPKMSPGPHLALTITDTGMGMDESTQSRIFEPFFTTKERGQGTGLGLASVYGMVQNHNGHIQVSSKPGKGTVFTLFFPALSSVNQPICAVTPPPAIEKNNAKILLVEDEVLILKYCAEMIQSLGYQVVTADSGYGAVELFKTQMDHIDLVILDMIMPGMDGWQTYQRLKQIDPRIKVIVTSGYADDSRIDAILSQGRNGNLKKPYARSNLEKAIAAILNPQNDGICQLQAEAVSVIP